MGGVLIEYSIPNQLGLIAEQLKVDENRVRKAYDLIRPKLDVAEISNQQFWSDMVRMSGSLANPKDTEHFWSDNYIADNPMIDGMLDLVEDLKAAGYRVGLLSNIDPEHGEINGGRGIYEHFSPALLSYKIKARKPEKAAYEALWKGLSVEPEEMIFVDDLDLNVSAAELYGMTGIKFTGREQLESDLRRLGVSF